SSSTVSGRRSSFVAPLADAPGVAPEDALREHPGAQATTATSAATNETVRGSFMMADSIARHAPTCRAMDLNGRLMVASYRLAMLPMLGTEEYDEPFPPETAVPLTQTYVGPGGGPTVTHVDTRIYTTSYFQPCMDCTFCADKCCQYGVSIDFANVDRIKAVARELRAYVSGPAERWFDDSDIVTDEPDFPGDSAIRSRLVDGTCIFRRPNAR